MTSGNAENLRLAARRKSDAATAWAEKALRETVKRGEPVTFRGIAKAGGVSIDFLYRSKDLRPRIEKLRAQARRALPTDPATSAGDSSVVRTLTEQLGDVTRRHREETKALQEALAAAHGENLELRRKLGERLPAGR